MWLDVFLFFLSDCEYGKQIVMTFNFSKKEAGPGDAAVWCYSDGTTPTGLQHGD